MRDHYWQVMKMEVEEARPTDYEFNDEGFDAWLEEQLEISMNEMLEKTGSDYEL